MMFNKAVNFIDMAGWALRKTVCTVYLRCLCRLKGIQLGRGSAFYGFSKFRRATGSSITLGRNITFRSASTSNLIGINRPSILCTFRRDAQIKTGDTCGFSGTVIGCFTSITLGNNVRCGANTLITDSDWHPDDPRSGEPSPVIIGDNVWLGVNATVLKGVTIGKNSVIGAGSVVTKDIPANVVAAGNPCKVIRHVKL